MFYRTTDLDQALGDLSTTVKIGWGLELLTLLFNMVSMNQVFMAIQIVACIML
jgi:hypothetical protein